MLRGLSQSAMDDSTTIFDGLLISRMRLVLALAGLLILYIDPTEPEQFATATYITLAIYATYSAILHLLAIKNHRIFQLSQSWTHWLDVGWYTILFMLGSGPGGLFFFGFIFSILSASFSHGYQSGLMVTTASTIIFTIGGLITYYKGVGTFELNRFLIRPIYLMVFGYMFSYWGGFEIRLRRRLTFLKNISRTSNLSFGVDRAMASIMKQIQMYFSANACLCVLKDNLPMYRLHSTRLIGAEMPAHAELITDEQAWPLLALPGKAVVAYCSTESGKWRWRVDYYAYDLDGRLRIREGQTESDAVAKLLDTKSFISVPLIFRHELLGRIYLTGSRRFDESDAQFLLQVMEQVLPIIDNIKLVDQLASNAAEEERRRIARDIHDSVIQPYIGLQLGLAALQRKLISGDPDSHKDAEKLIELTEVGISDLRHYVGALKENGKNAEELLAAIRRFATKFTDMTGIAVQVKVESEIGIKDWLAAEVFQMTAEGLSNIRRHTHSDKATVTLNCCQNLFALSIENDNEPGNVPAPFIPHSITERAESLNGHTRVDLSAERTSVIVEIPL